MPINFKNAVTNNAIYTVQELRNDCMFLQCHVRVSESIHTL